MKSSKRSNEYLIKLIPGVLWNGFSGPVHAILENKSDTPKEVYLGVKDKLKRTLVQSLLGVKPKKPSRMR